MPEATQEPLESPGSRLPAYRHPDLYRLRLRTLDAPRDIPILL